jgi:hypothetical protein
MKSRQRLLQENRKMRKALRLVDEAIALCEHLRHAMGTGTLRRMENA